VTDLAQGALFTVDRMGRRVPGVVWWNVCPTCRESSAEPHDHRAADLEMVLAELRRVSTPVAVAATVPAPVGEHLTMRELAEYAKRSVRWLSDQINAAVDPLPAAKPKGGKITVRRADYDRWLERQRLRESMSVTGVVADVLRDLNLKEGKS
jgi:hypothetical protein